MIPRPFLFRLGLLSVYLTMIGCQDSGSLDLVWSVRRGLVGQWAVRGEEVYTVGRYLGVYSLSTGQQVRRVRLSQDYGNMTLGRIGPEIAITDSNLVFGWYDFGGEEGKEGKIFCYNPKTLALRWERSLHLRKDVLELSPTFSVVVDGGYLYALAIAREGQNLFKLKLSDGEPMWSTTIEKYVQGVPLVLHDGKLLVRSRVSPWVRDAYGYFQAIHPETGKTIWRVRIDGKSGVSDDQPLISGDRAYVTTESSSPDAIHLYTIDLRRGTIVKHQLVYRLRPPLAEHHGVLYFGSSRPAAFRVGREEVLWQTHLHGPQGLGPPVVANGVLDPIRGEIYLGDWERYLYILSSTTGEVKDKVYIRGYWRGDFFSNPVKAFFGSYGVERLELVRGLLFMGTVDKSLFVFRRR